MFIVVSSSMYNPVHSLILIAASRSDDRVKALLVTFHRRGITDRNRISELLSQEIPPIQMRYGETCAASSTKPTDPVISPATVARRLKDFGLFASKRTMEALPLTEMQQLVLDQMAVDPKGKLGPRLIRENIQRQHGIHLTR